MLYGPGGLDDKVKEKQNLLGVGLGRAEVGTLRRVRKTTNRSYPSTWCASTTTSPGRGACSPSRTRWASSTRPLGSSPGAS